MLLFLLRLQLCHQVDVAYNWFDWIASVYHGSNLMNLVHKGLLALINLLFDSRNHGFHALLPLLILLGKGSKHLVPLLINLLPHIVVLEASVLLCRNVPVGVSNVARVNTLRAVHAIKNLLLLIESQTLSLKSDFGVFPC